MTVIPDEEEIEIALSAQRVLKRSKPKVTKRDTSEELKVTDIDISSSQPEAEESGTPGQKPEVIEHIIEPETIQVPIHDTALPAAAQPVATVEANAVLVPSSGCQYGFGYLRQRGKGEGIPDTCIECAKSLDCMLSEYYSAEKSVKEIKKWYDF